MTDLQSALGDVLSKPQALTDLLSSNSKTPSERDCAALAWFIAVERAGKHSIQMTVTVDGHIRFDLTTYIAPLLAHDWLANAMENLEKPST
jgi:hypothetical protein